MERPASPTSQVPGVEAFRNVLLDGYLRLLCGVVTERAASGAHCAQFAVRRARSADRRTILMTRALVPRVLISERGKVP
jgi:hypothetical protein